MAAGNWQFKTGLKTRNLLENNGETTQRFLGFNNLLIWGALNIHAFMSLSDCTL